MKKTRIFVSKIKQEIIAYNQPLFWGGNFACLTLIVLAISMVFKDYQKIDGYVLSATMIVLYSILIYVLNYIRREERKLKQI